MRTDFRLRTLGRERTETADRPDDLVELYRASDLAEAHALLALLEAGGVTARIDNELLSGAAGGLPPGWATAPKILITAADEPAAREILVQMARPVSVALGGPVEDASPRGAVARAVWWEVAAVLAVGVVPNLAGSVASLYHPVPPMPYWLDASYLSVLSGCTILVSLYLIARSGEPWARFGVVRPRASDAALGLLMLFIATAAFYLLPPLPDIGGRPAYPFTRPRGVVDYALMVVKFGLSAFAEELVTRAYLVTRLVMLLRSRGEAVLLAAVLFASYHVYQGSAGVVYALMFGVAYGIAFLAIGRLWPLVVGHTLYNVFLEITAG